MNGIALRTERAQDRAAIHAIIDAAFAGKPYAAGDEADLVDRLREAGALTVSLVATLGDVVVGQVALSPAFPDDGTPHWYALGPVSVRPDLQDRGIGAQLVCAGLDAIAARGARGCILTGNPAYYVRFGFAVSPTHAPADEPAEFFMVRATEGPLPTGAIRFHPLFHAEDR